MVDTKEASVSNPCLVLLPSLNAVVPAPSMLSGSLANHVLHRIQVCCVMGMPQYCQPSAPIFSLCIYGSHGERLHDPLQVPHIPCRGLEKGWSGFDHTLPTNSAIIWIAAHLCFPSEFLQLSNIPVLQSTCNLPCFLKLFHSVTFCRSCYKSRILQSVKINNFQIT